MGIRKQSLIEWKPRPESAQRSLTQMSGYDPELLLSLRNVHEDAAR